jgi:predicted metal-dependent phosphoesterase TrpH
LRVVSIQTAEDAATLRELVRGMQPGERVTAYGGRTPGASLDRAVTRALAKVTGGQDWRQNAIHSIRKMWAQAAYNAAYDAARDAGADPAAADRQACGVANVELGHSADRDDETAAYIGDARRSD